MTDRLQKFMFEYAAVRGELVEISQAWQQIQARHNYPKAVTKLLGEMVAAAALLTNSIKFHGSLIMQIHGDGPVQLLVVECDSALNIRGTAKLKPDAVIAEDATFHEMVHAHGKGRFAITLDPHDKTPGQQPYQGIVSLEGATIAQIIESYMQQSEQLDTRIWLAANEEVTRGLLLQKLPSKTGADGISIKSEEEQESWKHLLTLASTLGTEEMLATDIKTLKKRLFWEEEILVFAPLHPSFHCSCSRQRVSDMLRMLGKEEVEDALKEQGTLVINCEFCNQSYSFDSIDCAQLFMEDVSGGISNPPPIH